MRARRVFLDANILFSAAYREDSGLLRLWKPGGAALITSQYALEEARRNLDEPEQRARLAALAGKMMVIETAGAAPGLPPGVTLPEDDVPILLAAIACRATHLLTGDARAFGRYYGKTIGGVTVLKPSMFLAEK